MPIRFRCEHCQQLMSITRKKAGQLTQCPKCGEETHVPELQSAKRKDPPAVFVDEEPSGIGLEPAPEPTQKRTSSPEAQAERRVVEADDNEDDEPGFVLRRIQSDLDEMDLTPMVDVTFLLLIFFMVTASFSIEKSIEVPVPDPDQQGASQTVMPLEELEDQSILVEIDAANRYFIESEVVEDPRDLPQLLAEVRTRDSKSEVIIKVDERSHHEAIVAAIDAAQEVGMQRIRWGVMPEQ
ncbi:biopolymer transporter ExbD [Rubinisphaera margarita]|uniref:biopolymer transporter ExbD n=1 Tax=Rubinisphaera margarita TaxID=2909586 RepID=UPI001EE9A148|nr:biopolymer transporter ExbD [Rubinisphaera margarita]MCG6156282.1 biopolymer transporter ExbD [Rubinisphaera margarita]